MCHACKVILVIRMTVLILYAGAVKFVFVNKLQQLLYMLLIVSVSNCFCFTELFLQNSSVHVWVGHSTQVYR